jgi:hypothetical protein
MMLGTRRMRVMIVTSCCEAAANLVLSLALIRPFGLLGVALGTMIPQVIAYGVVYPVYLVPKYRIGWGTYSRQVIQPVLLAIVSIAAPGMLLVRYATPQTWPQLLGQAFAVSVVLAVVIYTAALQPHERTMLRARLGLRVAAKS